MTDPIIFARRPRTDPVKVAARIYRDEGARPQQAIVRAMVDQMREEMDLPPAQWPQPSWWDR